jgi:hypothetical protein
MHALRTHAAAHPARSPAPHTTPQLIYDALHSKAAAADGAAAEGFEGVGALMPPGLFDNGRAGRGDMALGWEELSGKLALVARLLAVLRATCDDKCVRACVRACAWRSWACEQFCVLAANTGMQPVADASCCVADTYTHTHTCTRTHTHCCAGWSSSATTLRRWTCLPHCVGSARTSLCGWTARPPSASARSWCNSSTRRAHRWGCVQGRCSHATVSPQALNLGLTHVRVCAMHAVRAGVCVLAVQQGRRLRGELSDRCMIMAHSGR